MALTPLVTCNRSVGLAPKYAKYIITVHVILYAGGGRDENYDRKFDSQESQG